MEVVSNNYMPGDPRLVQQLVYELKSQGIFDQFRKECIADVDTKPAYQNLRQRVEGSVTSFLTQQTWRPDMNKNQVREQLRKSIYESGYLETGVERIVDQVVNPKINTVFLPQVEEVVYRYLGIEKPNRLENKKELKVDVTDLLPTDLEAVSPESDHTKDDSLNLNESLNVDSKLEEDESPPFEPLDVQDNDVQHNDIQNEDNSVDSHLSGFSGLQSHDSNPCNETKFCQMELSNQDSQISHNSSESHLSIITSEENTKLEVCEESESKLLKFNESEAKIEICAEANTDKNCIQEDTEEIKVMEIDRKDEKTFDEKKSEDKKAIEKKNDDRKYEERKNEEKKHNERRSDDKKSRNSEKHSKDKKDDKYRKSSGSSTSRDKDKTASRHSSSSSSKDKSKDKKESKTSSSNNKDKVEKDKDKPEKERPEKEKIKTDKDRERSDRDKNKSSSSSSSKHSNSKDKDRGSSSSKKESSGKDKEKEKSRSSGSSTSKDSKSKSNHTDSKSKSSTDKYKKDEKNSHNGKHSSSSSSIKKEKDRKRDSKKELKDDHYSSKEKKNYRRSTDRDSNDGQSSRQSQSNSFTESSSSHTQKNSQESSNSNSGSGSGESGNSDQIEQIRDNSPVKFSGPIENKEVTTICADIQKFKYMKPKFASNFEEARKLMKIRKQLAKLERQNQLSLAQIEVSVEIPAINGVTHTEENNTEEVDKIDDFNTKPQTPENKEIISSPKDVTPMLQSTELSKENWEALEARLAQEMSNINYNSYESPYDYDYDYAGYNSIVLSPRKNIVADKKHIVKEENIDKTLNCSKLDYEKEEELPSEKKQDVLVVAFKQPSQEVVVKKHPKNNIEKRRELRVELEASIYKSSKGVIKIIEKGEKCIRGNLSTKNGDKYRQDVIGNKKFVEINKHSAEKEIVSHRETDLDIINKSNKKNQNLSDIDYECRYLEIPSPNLENNLQFIRRFIKKLEQDVEHSVKASQNNFLPIKRVGGKRKLEENVDLKNNNKAHYEQVTETKKRKRSIAPNPNSVISKANKEKMCNSTDISPNDSFSLPLSPAESDKSNDKKEDESPKPVKQKRIVFGKNTSTRSQRYSSEDLYKPRPTITSTRSRSAKNPGN